MNKFLSKLFKKKQKETIYTTITTISLGAEVKIEYRCKNCRMIIPIDYPHCPYCGLKAVNSSFRLEYLERIHQ